jgi:hypothetical protein
MEVEQSIFVPYGEFAKVTHYLLTFMLCLENFHIGTWRTLRAGVNGPLIFHLMFSDDLLLFREATDP